MCPGCVASAAMMIATVVSTSGLTAVLMKKLGAKYGTKKSVQNPNPEEETWAK
jgi:hypothetical protein